MRKLAVFNSVTLDGYFTGRNGDLSWAKSRDDAEWMPSPPKRERRRCPRVRQGDVRDDGELLADAGGAQGRPVVAERMNNLPKVVFSRTLDEATWNNTKLVKGDPAAEMRTMKKESGEDMVILGSGSIVSRLAQEGLIDEYQIVVTPVVLGEGRTMFEGVKRKMT